MAEQIKLHSFRKEVDSTYVGFTPNGGSIKPVHVANGVQRCIFGGFNTAMQIKRLALVSDAKGNVPTGSELETIYAELAKNEAIEDGIAEGSVESMRNVMQRLLSADKGVYVVKGLKDDMISFTAGSKYFLTRSSIYEDTGEFIGGLIHSYCPELAEYIKRLLDEAEDPISLLFEPVSESSLQIFEKSRHEDLPAFKSQNEAVKWYLKGLNESGLCLMDNLKRHPNPLTQLRLFNFFCIFHLVRYMALLEAFYCGENIRPVLLDFSGIAPSQSSVARASEMAYTQMHKSINRFYAWGYAQMVVLPTKTVRHETVQFQKAAVVFGEKNTVIVVSDFFCKRCGEIALNGVDILHPSCFNRTFLVPPLKNRTVFGKAHRIHTAFFGFCNVLSVFCDRINIGNAI